VSVKNGLEVLASSHSFFLSALHALAVGRNPYFYFAPFPWDNYSIAQIKEIARGKLRRYTSKS
jgi:hypothetical protein